MRNIIYTTHHKLSKSYGGTNNPNNLIRLREKLHQGVHSVFQDETPIQQHRSLLEMNKMAMSPVVYYAISDTLRRFEGIMELNCYDKNCINEDKFIQRFYNKN